jgi:type IV pilus assembly protein PilX
MRNRRRYIQHIQTIRPQRGAALIIALLMLIVLLMLGIGAMHIGLQSEKMSRNLRDRQIAWQAAEAALLDAEYVIGQTPPDKITSDNRNSVIYGSDSGRTMQTGVGILPAQPPRYTIEALPPTTGKPPEPGRRYRINALGFGPDRHTRVMLQSIYRKQSPPALSARLSWREITTW